VSSLAWFMSNQETSFVTIGQRVLARPLKYVLSPVLSFFVLMTYSKAFFLLQVLAHFEASQNNLSYYIIENGIIF
jgi:hypothetical protein